MPLPEEIRGERWMGGVDEKLRNLLEDLRSAATNLSELDKKVQNLQNQVTKLVVGMALGAFFGSAIISVVVGVLIKIIAK
jgi:hypothetical protein